jgi:hypothetical protein
VAGGSVVDGTVHALACHMRRNVMTQHFLLRSGC